VLAVARRWLPAEPADLRDEERRLTLVALVGLRDPVRPTARETVRAAADAGIDLVMVTGDHPATASAVAAAVGLDRAGDVRTGRDLAQGGMPEDPLDVRVYARVEPEQKLELVEALQAHGHVVAVTGDGVNDAPALRRADIGVAMGKAGSDVAREAADMVVTDDDLSTILVAVREGRAIYDNIRKVVDYLIAGNLSEIMVVVGALLLFPALGTALLPLQLLWINLLTDGAPALALSVDPADPELMQRHPRGVRDRLLSGPRLALLWARGALIATGSVGSLVVARFVLDQPWAHARTVMFTTLMTAHLLYAFVARLPARPTRRAWAANRWLLGAVLLSLGLQLLVVAVGPMRALFGTFPLSAPEWALVLACGIGPVALMRLTPLGRPMLASGVG
jgi:Ca2+-transporting ATPase